MEEKRTVDTILATLREKVEKKEVLPPWMWLEAAADLNLLLEDEQDILFTLQQTVAIKKRDVLSGQDKVNVSMATLIVEASDEYKKLCQQRAKVGRVVEQIKIAKSQARLRADGIGGYTL